MQISGNGMGLVIRNTFKNEGVGSFWKGIVWAWGREGSYASIKLGAYAPVRDALGAGGKDGTFLSMGDSHFWIENHKILAGSSLMQCSLYLPT